MGVGVRRADIQVRPMNITPPRMNITPPRMNITPPRMSIQQRPMNITPSRRVSQPDYKIPEVVTPRKRELLPIRPADEAARGVRPGSPDRLIVTSRGASSGFTGRSPGVRPESGEGRGEGRGERSDESRGEGRGDGRNDGRDGGRGDGRGEQPRDVIRDHDDRIRRPNEADRLREQRDRNTRGDGRHDGRDDDRDRDDRYGHGRDYGRGYRYPDSHRGYYVSRPSDYFLCDRPTYRYTGSGLSIRGGYLGDRFSVDARLTSGIYGLDGFRPGTFYPSSTWLTCNNNWVGGHWNGYYWSTFDAPYGYPSSYWSQTGARTDLTNAVPASDARTVESESAYAGVVDGDVRMRAMRTPVQVPVDDSGAMTSQSLAPVVDYTPLDRGIEAIILGDPARGADELRVHLREHRDDGRALRLLAVALAESSEPVDAAAVMRMAHEMDPALATESVGLAALGYDDARLRNLIDKSVIHAHRVKSQHSTEAASAWLVVGVLMREQGRDDLAREMVKRARAAGLREDVVETLELAWR